MFVYKVRQISNSLEKLNHETINPESFQRELYFLFVISIFASKLRPTDVITKCYRKTILGRGALVIRIMRFANQTKRFYKYEYIFFRDIV
jgi:hypothetical protein